MIAAPDFVADFISALPSLVSELITTISAEDFVYEWAFLITRASLMGTAGHHFLHLGEGAFVYDGFMIILYFYLWLLSGILVLFFI